MIEAREVSRWYGIVMGLNNVSFTIGPGLTGLVGPNGAGKSTLIRIVTGQIQPSSGTLTVFGERPWNNPRLLRRIGYCPEDEAVPGDLKPLEWIEGLAMLSGLSGREARRQSRAMLERVGLARAHWAKKLGRYSKGMRQRVKLAQALMHEPDLLVLDEPMNGLDPLGRQEIAETLKGLAAEGKTLLVSSHILPELESLSKEILIMTWGRIVASGSQHEIRADLKNWSEQLSIRCDNPGKLARHLFDADALLGFYIEDEDMLNIHIKEPTTFYSRWPGLLLDSHVTVYEVRSRSRSLKQIFERITA